MSVKASFDGVEFETIRVRETGYNKKAVIHDIVNGYGAYVEVLGNGAEIWEFEGYLDNNDGLYVDRDLIRIVFMDVGIGQLWHPSLGMVQAACISVSTEEDASRLGIIGFTAQFVVARNTSYSLTNNTGSLLQTVTSIASTVLTSSSVTGLNTTALGLVNNGTAIMGGISGVDSVLNPSGYTLGRYYQSGTMNASTLNSYSQTMNDSALIASVTASQSSVISALT